jgi:hypothetical protein
MATQADPVEQLVRDFQQRGWSAHPFERTIEIAQSTPQDVARLLHIALREIPEGGTFLDAALSFLDPDAFPHIVTAALAVLRHNHKNELAESVVAYASLQFPTALHPHLTDIFELAPNQGTYFEDWPWRESGKQHLPFLQAILVDPTQPVAAGMKAWLAMLETRDSDVLLHALSFVDRLDLPHDPRIYLNEIGFDLSDGHLRQLYADQVYHLRFAPKYLATESHPFWLQKAYHPTWRLRTENALVLPFGGVSSTRCAVCGGQLHHLITFEPIPAGLPVTDIPKLELAACLSCLGWEQRNLFYKHNHTGQPKQVGYDGSRIIPQFPAEPLQATQIHLVETPIRWRWQDWGLSNSRENLHRVGGFPCWIQSAKYLPCPECHRTMQFLMQLDSDLPTVDSGEWSWGSGGICYICWCNECKISGYVWQCT